MHIHDLPLPLRLRNTLERAGFKTDADIRSHFDTDNDIAIEGVGATGMRQLMDWLARPADEPAAKLTGGPEVIRRRPAKAAEPVDTDSKPRDAVGARETDEDASIYRRDSVVTPGRWGQMADTSMRGGLESLDSRRHEADAMAVHQRQYKAALENQRINHQWDAEDAYRTPARPPEAELTARLTAMKAAAARFGGETHVETSKDTLTLRLEPELQKQIGQMIPLIKGLAHVKELGVEVSRETVARMALIRGLDALERQYKAKTDTKTADPAPEEPSEAPISAAEPKNGVHPTPEGWTRVAVGDKIPVAQAVIHDYYTQNNWNRYWGKAGDSVIYFYWSPEVQFQDLDVFPGSDKNGKTVAVQDTPWGPGHIIPVNWTNQ
jgi:hypothetical protein